MSKKYIDSEGFAKKRLPSSGLQITTLELISQCPLQVLKLILTGSTLTTSSTLLCLGGRPLGSL